VVVTRIDLYCAIVGLGKLNQRVFLIPSIEVFAGNNRNFSTLSSLDIYRTTDI
jgi:hypothetical protein